MALAAPLSVLVVEDNAADAELAMEALSAGPAGTRVQLAKNGREALMDLRGPAATSAPARVGLILLDLNLPRHSGLDTLADLKADPELCRIPVVVLTTSKSAQEINRSYELGAAAVLNKPLRLAEYRTMLNSFTNFWLEHVKFPREQG